MKLTHVVLGAAAAALLSSAALAEEMTIVSWGGAYSASQDKAYNQPYMKLNPGVKIINDTSSNEAVAKLRAMNEAGNVTWDVVDVVASDAMRLCDEGLAMVIDPDTMLAPADNDQALRAIINKMDPDTMSLSATIATIATLKSLTGETSASEDFGDLLVSECYIPNIVYSTTFGYRTDVAAWGGREPDDICDIFDLENFPGKRSLEKRPLNNVEWALLCDGVAPEDVYDVLSTPEGVDRALAKLGTIRDNVLWWSAGAETPQRLADGEVVLGSTYNGRLFALIEEQGQPVKMLWDWQVFDLDGWIIPTGLSEERKARALHYIYFASDTQRLADQAKYISYGPARASSAPLVGKHATLGIDMAPHMPTNPDNAKNTFLYNWEWWADNRDDLDAKFQAWLVK